jgi:hypothetical protein
MNYINCNKILINSGKMLVECKFTAACNIIVRRFSIFMYTVWYAEAR